MPTKINLQKMDMNSQISLDRLYEYFEKSSNNYASQRLAISTSVEERLKIHDGGALPWTLVLDDDNTGTLYEGSKKNSDVFGEYRLNSDDESKIHAVDKLDRIAFESLFVEYQDSLKKEIIKQSPFSIFAGYNASRAISIADKFVNKPASSLSHLSFGEVLELAKVVRAIGSIKQKEAIERAAAEKASAEEREKEQQTQLQRKKQLAAASLTLNHIKQFEIKEK